MEFFWMCVRTITCEWLFVCVNWPCESPDLGGPGKEMLNNNNNNNNNNQDNNSPSQIFIAFMQILPNECVWVCFYECLCVCVLERLCVNALVSDEVT